MGQSPHVCGYERCGRSFAAPLRLTDLSHKPHLETYYACPYCFSKMDATELGDINEVKLLSGGGYEISAPESLKKGKVGAQKDSGKPALAVNCPHQLGYLKTRSKNEAVPDSCLICPRILQCMA